MQNNFDALKLRLVSLDEVVEQCSSVPVVTELR